MSLNDCVLMEEMLLLVLLGAVGSVTSQPPNDNVQSSVLNPEEMFRDMLPLTRDNFTAEVFRTKDPWIVIFHDGSVAREWKTMATHMRGLCWFGVVDITNDTKFLEDIKFNKDRDIARVYPYGDKTAKERSMRRVSTQNEARTVILSSLPDKTFPLTSGNMQDFFTECFLSHPTQFPTYIIIDENETPSLFKAIAQRFERYFRFGRMTRPSADDLRTLGLQSIYINPPALFVIVTRNGKLDNFSAVEFDVNSSGDMNYTSIMQFLFSINTQFRHELPGDNQSHNQREAEMGDIIRIEEKRFEIFLNGQNRVVDKFESSTIPENNIYLKASRIDRSKDEL